MQNKKKTEKRNFPAKGIVNVKRETGLLESKRRRHKK